MEPQWEPAREPAAAKAWAGILRPVAAEARDHLRELSEHTVERMRAVTPAAFADPTALEQVRSNAEGGFLAVVESIERGSDPAMIELPAGLLAGARTRAQTGFPLTQLLRAHRMAHECLAEWMVEAIARRHGAFEETAAALQLCSSWLFARACRRRSARWPRSPSSPRRPPRRSRPRHRSRRPPLSRSRRRLRSSCAARTRWASSWPGSR